MIKHSRTIIVVIFLMLFITLSVWAHPHMALDTSIEFEISQNKCVSLTVELLFDPIFGASIIGEYDRDKDGLFNPEENRAVKVAAFDNLKKYGYFVFLRKDDLRMNPEHITDFQAYKRKSLLVYRFRVPLDSSLFSNDFHVAVFDSTYYCQVFYMDVPGKAVDLDGNGRIIKTDISTAINNEYPIFYNPYGSPSDFKLYTKWESGLETACPNEIHFVLKE